MDAYGYQYVNILSICLQHQHEESCAGPALITSVLLFVSQFFTALVTLCSLSPLLVRDVETGWRSSLLRTQKGQRIWRVEGVQESLSKWFALPALIIHFTSFLLVVIAPVQKEMRAKREDASLAWCVPVNLYQHHCP